MLLMSTPRNSVQCISAAGGPRQRASVVYEQLHTVRTELCSDDVAVETYAAGLQARSVLSPPPHSAPRSRRSCPCSPHRSRLLASPSPSASSPTRPQPDLALALLLASACRRRLLDDHGSGGRRGGGFAIVAIAVLRCYQTSPSIRPCRRGEEGDVRVARPRLRQAMCLF